MAFNPYDIRLAPPQEPYKSVADIQAETAQADAAKMQIKAAMDKQRQAQLVKSVVAKHVTQDPATGAPTIDHEAVKVELYRVDPEVAQLYEQTQLAADAAKAQQAAAVAETKRKQMDWAKGRVQEAIASVDTDSPDAEAMFNEAVNGLKADNIPVDPSHLKYSPAWVRQQQRAMIGAKDIYDKTAAAAVNDADNAAAAAKNKADIASREGMNSADNARAIQVANITGQYGVNRAQVTGEAGIERAGITAAGKNATGGPIPALVPVTNNPFQSRFAVSSPEGPRKAPMAGASTNHPGVDYATPMNTPVPAKTGGVVVSAGPQGGYGNQVRVKFDDGTEQSYSHLSRINVKAGDKVAAGDVLALTGSTGTSTGPHVHVQDYGGNAENNAADPLKIVLEYKGPSVAKMEVDKRALNTHPWVKAGADPSIDSQINDLSNVLRVMDAGGRTGPGTTILNAKDRALAAIGSIADINIGDAASRKARINAYDVMQKAATTQGIAALAGVGGNDTDKDFDRAMTTTIGNLRTKEFNKATAQTLIALLNLNKERAAFAKKWAAATGSPNNPALGMTMEEGWSKYAAPKTKAIGELAVRNGLIPATKAAKGPPPKLTGAIRQLRKGDTYYSQMPNGSLVKQ